MRVSHKLYIKENCIFIEIIDSLISIITGVSTVITIYGFFLMYDDLAKKSAIVGLICGILFLGINFWLNTKGNNEPIQPNEVVQEEVQSKPVQAIPEITYEPAELVECVELENGAYQMLFSVGESEVQLFSWIDTYTYPDDTPYLLTMDNKGTLNNPLDDEILVVWKDMN